MSEKRRAERTADVAWDVVATGIIIILIWVVALLATALWSRP